MKTFLKKVLYRLVIPVLVLTVFFIGLEYFSGWRYGYCKKTILEYTDPYGNMIKDSTYWQTPQAKDDHYLMMFYEAPPVKVRVANTIHEVSSYLKFGIIAASDTVDMSHSGILFYPVNITVLSGSKIFRQYHIDKWHDGYILW